MSNREHFDVIRVDREKLFQDQFSGKIFDMISSHKFTPKDQKNHFIKFSVIRGGQVFDSGEYQFINKDGQDFVSKKIFQDYFRMESIEQSHCDCFLPEMFDVGDELLIEHNSLRSVSEQIIKFDPPIEEFHKVNNELDFYALHAKNEIEAKEIFPEIYRFRKTKALKS